MRQKQRTWMNFIFAVCSSSERMKKDTFRRLIGEICLISECVGTKLARNMDYKERRFMLIEF